MRLHYLQHVPFENPGSILTWAAMQDFKVTKTLLFNDEDLPSHNDYDWLVIMGGPMNIYDEKNYPWLAKEKSFIHNAIEAGKLIIGFCLGGQLIADVIGGKVTKNPHLEIGWFPVRFTDESRSYETYSFFPEYTNVFHWHGDTFSKLPKNAVCMAENDACSHQAFVYNKRVFGFQFHLEITPKIISDLVDKCGDEMLPGPYVQSKNELLNYEYNKQANEWMNIFLTKLKKLEDRRCFDE